MAEDTLSKIIDYIFKIKRVNLILISILILGFILRLIAAINLSVSADDMHFVTHAVNFFSSGKLVTYDQSAGLWFAFTSLMYKFLGYTQLASRLAALIFGSLTILVVYLLTKEFFNEKVSLLAAFALAIAPFHIKNTIAEMDVMAMFFVLCSMLFFIRALKKENKKYFIFSGIFIGIAIYTKVYPLLFIPSMVLLFILNLRKEKKKVFNKKNLVLIALFLFSAFIFTLPALSHNYLLYKDKGFLDLQFTRTFDIGKDVSEKHYSWDHQFNARNDWKGLILGNSENAGSKIPTLFIAIDFIRTGDPLIFYLGAIGLIISILSKKKEYPLFFLISILFILPFLASIILLPKHFLFLEIFLIPLAALSIEGIIKKSSLVLNKNYTKFFLIAIIVIALLLLGSPNTNTLYHFYGKSHVTQFIDFKEESIPQNSLIIGDSRIYRGRVHWMSLGRPYLEASELITLMNNVDTIPGEEVSTDVYFFECIPDDCGWGTIKDQPEFNSSMESLVSFFKENGQLIKTIKEPNRYSYYYPLISSTKKEDIINVYNAKINLKKPIVQLASQPKNWFLYDIGYIPKEKQFDYYETTGIGKLIEKLAKFIVILALLLTFLSPIYILYNTFKEETINNNTSI